MNCFHAERPLLANRLVTSVSKLIENGTKDSRGCGSVGGGTMVALDGCIMPIAVSKQAPQKMPDDKQNDWMI